MEDITDAPRLPPRLDRYAEFLKQWQNPNTSSSTVGGNQRGAVSMDEGVLPDIIQRDFACYANGCGETFRTRKDCEIHYNGKHRYICSICKKIFNSSHLLELHVIETHDTYFAVMSKTRPMYECFLESCTQKFNNEDERFTHCIEQHKDKRPFYFPRSKSLNQPPTNKIQNDKSSTEMVVDFEVVRGEGEINSIQGNDLKSNSESSNSLICLKKVSKNISTKNMHISFGQKAVKFIPRSTFALSKKKTIKKTTNEEKMDLTEMNDVLTEFLKEPAPTASALTENLVNIEELAALSESSVVQSESKSTVEETLINEIPDLQTNIIGTGEFDGGTEKRKWKDEGKVGDIKKIKFI